MNESVYNNIEYDSDKKVIIFSGNQLRNECEVDENGFNCLITTVFIAENPNIMVKAYKLYFSENIQMTTHNGIIMFYIYVASALTFLNCMCIFKYTIEEIKRILPPILENMKTKFSIRPENYKVESRWNPGNKETDDICFQSSTSTGWGNTYDLGNYTTSYDIDETNCLYTKEGEYIISYGALFQCLLSESINDYVIERTFITTESFRSPVPLVIFTIRDIIISNNLVIREFDIKDIKTETYNYTDLYETKLMSDCFLAYCRGYEKDVILVIDRDDPTEIMTFYKQE